MMVSIPWEAIGRVAGLILFEIVLLGGLIAIPLGLGIEQIVSK